jgi:hypothetical protein
VRRASVRWDTRRIRRTLVPGAIGAIAVCALGVTGYGALAAASGMLLGALIVNARAMVFAFAHCEEQASQRE